jgi:hypothetical protein
MSNEIKARYSADISQMEIANDKLAAQNDKLAKQVAALTNKASGFNKTYGNSWNAVKNRVEEYTRAVKGATNLREWYGAVEKLQAAKAQFEQINASVEQFTQSQKEATVVATHMKDSYNDLESRLRGVREEMKQFATSTAEFKRLAVEEGKLKTGMEAFNNEVARIQLETKGAGAITTLDQLGKRIANLRQQYKLLDDADSSKADAAKKIERMQAVYDRMSAAVKESSKDLEENAASARHASDSLKGMDKTIEAMTKRATSISSTSDEFRELTAEIRALTNARQQLQAQFKHVDVKPEKTYSAIPLGSLQAKVMQRNFLEKSAQGLSGQQFDAVATKIRALNEDIAKMESLFKKAESTMVIDPVVINSVEGLTARIAHLQERMSKVGNQSIMKWSVDPNTGASVQTNVPSGPSREYKQMAAELVALKKSLRELKALQDIPVDKVVTARLSYDALREAIERTKKAREGAVIDSPEFKHHTELLTRMDALYKRLTASMEVNAKAKRKENVEIKAAGNSMEGLAKQIEHLEGKQKKVGPGAEFDRLSNIIAKLQARLKAMQADAAKAGEALSKGATAAAGSFNRLDYELKKAKEDLKGLTEGTKEFIAQQAKIKELQTQWDRLDKAINKTTKATKGTSGVVGTLVGQAKSLAATYVGMHEVVSQMTQEWEKQRNFQLQIAAKGQGNEGALVNQAANIGADNMPMVKNWARANQADMFGKQEDIINLVGAAISAGAGDIKEAMGSVQAAMKMAVGNPAIAQEMLVGGLTVARLNNSNDYESALGQLRSSSSASQAVDENQFIANVMGKVAALTRGRKNMDGMTSERSLEYITAASRIQADTTGDSSSTNMQAIFQRMDEFVPEAKKKLKDKTTSTVDKAVIEEFKKARTFDEKMALLQKNKDLGNQYIDKQRTGGPKELAFALIQNNAATQKIMAESKDAVLPFKEAGKFFRAETEKIVNAAPNLAIKKRADAKLEQSITGDKPTLLATARAEWDSIWNGNADRPAVPLTGWDQGIRAQSAWDRNLWGKTRAIGTNNDGGNEVTDMVASLKEIIKGQQEAGDAQSANALKAQLEALEKIAAKLDELNSRVAGAAPPAVGRPNPVRPAPVPRAAVVP